MMFDATRFRLLLDCRVLNFFHPFRFIRMFLSKKKVTLTNHFFRSLRIAEEVSWSGESNSSHEANFGLTRIPDRLKCAEVH